MNSESRRRDMEHLTAEEAVGRALFDIAISHVMEGGELPDFHEADYRATLRDCANRDLSTSGRPARATEKTVERVLARSLPSIRRAFYPEK